MKFELIVILFVSFLVVSFDMPNHIQKKVNKEIKTTFNIDAFSLNSVEIESNITNKLPSIFNQKNFFEIHLNETLLGYAYVSKAPSKTDEFDYLVLLDEDLIVIKSKVLIYREDYGGEIGSKRWLKQFIGKTPTDELRYGDNITAISGATISVRSMTNALNNFLKSIQILHIKGII